MATSIRQRSHGFSRRAHMGAFLISVLGVLAVIIGLALLLLSRVAPSSYDAVRGLMLDVTAPVTGALRLPVDGAVHLLDRASDHFHTVEQNRLLTVQNEQLRRALAQTQAKLRKSSALEALAKTAEPGRQPLVRARLIGASPTGFIRSAVLAAGTRVGVHPGQPVLAAEGLIGRIVEAGTSASRVLLLTDGDSRVPVRLARSGAPALATGHEDGLVELHPIEGDRNPFRPGDLVTTSGLGGIYPPDVPVAVVLRREGDGALARPLASPARAEYVVVERPWFPPASVLPAVKPR